MTDNEMKWVGGIILGVLILLVWAVNLVATRLRELGEKADTIHEDLERIGKTAHRQCELHAGRPDPAPTDPYGRP